MKFAKIAIAAADIPEAEEAGARLRALYSCVSADEADVIVLNTCCIRENADNKLYGALGQISKLVRERSRWQGCSTVSQKKAIQARSLRSRCFGVLDTFQCI